MSTRNQVASRGPKRGEIWEYHGMPCRITKVGGGIATVRTPDGKDFHIFTAEMHRAKGWIKQESGWKSYEMGNKVICYER